MGKQPGRRSHQSQWLHDFAARFERTLLNSSVVGAPVNLLPLTKKVGVELTSSSFEATRRCSTMRFSSAVFLRQASNSSLPMPPNLASRASASRYSFVAAHFSCDAKNVSVKA